ncbi:MAG: hypothetical protein M0R50_08125, partial [Candidatus Cloacimonetes bacterium]|nr:hypothetical protein [Candidatus Cloacimonadota bacterium]
MKIIERNLRKTGSRRVGKHQYPRDSFGYVNYNTDPKPDVLVLGNWKNPSTKNNLIGGVNLNYLSSGQIVKLRKIVDRIFNRDSLRARYRYLKSKSPDIAMFYRTYDSKYIKSVERSELDSYTKAKSNAKDEKVKTKADKDKAVHAPETKSDNDVAELDRDMWQLKRRLYEPEKQRRRTSPERLGIAGSKAAKKAKAARYIRDRRKMKEMEKQLELAKELKKIVEPEEPEEPKIKKKPESDIEYPDYGVEEPEDDYGPEYHLDDLGYESKIPKRSMSGYNFMPQIGYIWDSKDSYIDNHTPGRKLLIESKHNLLAVFDTISKRFIVDSVSNHAEMLFDAGWDYDHVVLFEVSNNELIVKSDCSDIDIKN